VVASADWLLVVAVVAVGLLVARFRPGFKHALSTPDVPGVCVGLLAIVMALDPKWVEQNQLYFLVPSIVLALWVMATVVARGQKEYAKQKTQHASQTKVTEIHSMTTSLMAYLVPVKDEATTDLAPQRRALYDRIVGMPQLVVDSWRWLQFSRSGILFLGPSRGINPNPEIPMWLKLKVLDLRALEDFLKNIRPSLVREVEAARVLGFSNNRLDTLLAEGPADIEDVPAVAAVFKYVIEQLGGIASDRRPEMAARTIELVTDLSEPRRLIVTAHIRVWNRGSVDSRTDTWQAFIRYRGQEIIAHTALPPYPEPPANFPQRPIIGQVVPAWDKVEGFLSASFYDLPVGAERQAVRFRFVDSEGTIILSPAMQWIPEIAQE
jgi:hypothetical protein